MAVMALIALLTVGGSVSLRRQAEASDVAEKLLSTIRDAQNRAVSVQKYSGATKVWAFEVDSVGNFFRLNAFNEVGAELIATPLESFNLPSGVTVKSYYVGGNGVSAIDTSKRFIEFNSPFGRPFTSQNACASNGADACEWTKTDPADEWVLVGGGTGSTFVSNTAEEKIDFEITYDGDKKIHVFFNERGESYIDY